MTIFDRIDQEHLERIEHELTEIASGRYPAEIYRYPEGDEMVEPSHRHAAELGYSQAAAREASGVLGAILRPRIKRTFPDPREHSCKRSRLDDCCWVCGEVIR